MKRQSGPSHLYHDYWEYILAENPTYATFLGDHRFDDKLGHLSEAAFSARIRKYQDLLQALHQYRQPSEPAERLNYLLFERELEDMLEEAKFRPYLTPITQQSGPHIELPQLVTYHPFRTLRDFENYLIRLQEIPRVFDQLISCMERGIIEQLVQPWTVVEKIVPQLDAFIVQDPERSEFYKPFLNISKLATSDLSEIHARGGRSVMESVIPAYTKLREFVHDHYLQKARKEDGVWSLPDGKRRYEFYIRHHTTTRLSPDTIHQIGLDELRRIHGEMKSLLRKRSFQGSLQEYASQLRNDPSMYYTSGAELLSGFEQILRRVEEKLPELFARLPMAKFDLREMEAYRADSAPDAYYYPPPEDGSRPAYFYVNTFRPETRPKYTMEALAYHEAMPGHHLQLGLQQQLDGLPKFRRHGGYSAFVEGWALYSERLPKEIGFYHSPESDFGRLTLEAWRAARLVVDTGIHHKHWTREMAIRFMEENTALTKQNIASEVDRYIAWPAQALAYKIGQLKISEIRLKIEKKLGKRFDIRRFHDELLNDGGLAMDVLESKMNHWLSSQIRQA